MAKGLLGFRWRGVAAARFEDSAGGGAEGIFAGFGGGDGGADGVYVESNIQHPTSNAEHPMGLAPNFEHHLTLPSSADVRGIIFSGDAGGGRRLR